MKFPGIGYGRIVIFLLTVTSRAEIVFLWVGLGEIVLTYKVNIYGVNYVGGRLY